MFILSTCLQYSSWTHIHKRSKDRYIYIYLYIHKQFRLHMCTLHNTYIRYKYVYRSMQQMVRHTYKCYVGVAFHTLPCIDTQNENAYATQICEVDLSSYKNFVIYIIRSCLYMISNSKKFPIMHYKSFPN